VTVLAVADLLARYAPAYHGSWDNAVRQMLAEPADAEIITQLRAERAAAGRFRRPVVVDDERQVIGDGMHRVVAAITGRYPRLEVADGYPDGDGDELEVTFTLDSPDDDDGAFEQAVDWLRSFPLAGTWVTCDTFSHISGRYHAVYYCPASLADALRSAVAARAEAHGLRVQVLNVQPPEPYDEGPCLRCGQ